MRVALFLGVVTRERRAAPGVAKAAVYFYLTTNPNGI